MIRLSLLSLQLDCKHTILNSGRCSQCTILIASRMWVQWRTASLYFEYRKLRYAVNNAFDLLRRFLRRKMCALSTLRCHCQCCPVSMRYIFGLKWYHNVRESFQFSPISKSHDPLPLFSFCGNYREIPFAVCTIAHTHTSGKLMAKSCWWKWRQNGGDGSSSRIDIDEGEIMFTMTVVVSRSRLSRQHFCRLIRNHHTWRKHRYVRSILTHWQQALPHKIDVFKFTVSTTISFLQSPSSIASTGIVTTHIDMRLIFRPFFSFSVFAVDLPNKAKTKIFCVMFPAHLSANTRAAQDSGDNVTRDKQMFYGRVCCVYRCVVVISIEWRCNCDNRNKSFFELWQWNRE